MSGVRDPGSPGDDLDPVEGIVDEGPQENDAEDVEDEFPDGDEPEGEDGDGDEAVDAGDGADEAGGQAQEARRDVRPGRRTTSDEIRDLRRRAQEAERREQQFQQQLAQLVQGRSQADLQREQQQEQERYALLNPEERIEYRLQQMERNSQMREQQLRAQLFDQSDKLQYDNLVAQNPAYKKFDAKVEEFRRQAPNVPRHLLLATAIGQAAMERGGQARGRAQNTAERRARANVTNPPAGRGAAAGRQRTGQGLEDRLRGQTI